MHREVIGCANITITGKCTGILTSYTLLRLLTTQAWKLPAVTTPFTFRKSLKCFTASLPPPPPHASCTSHWCTSLHVHISLCTYHKNFINSHASSEEHKQLFEWQAETQSGAVCLSRRHKDTERLDVSIFQFSRVSSWTRRELWFTRCHGRQKRL